MWRRRVVKGEDRADRHVEKGGEKARTEQAHGGMREHRL
jgi:hypothetical protein